MNLTLVLVFTLSPTFVLFKNSNLLPQTSNQPAIGNPFILLPAVDSTNNYAMALVHEGMATHGTAVFAVEQTEGKGQRGKVWASTAGMNIIMSTILKPPPAESNPFLLSAAIALACYDLLFLLIGNDLSVKWPNDLYWRDRKAGGILIENSFRGKEWNFAIAGTGLNINQDIFPVGLEHAVSVKQITGKTYNAVALAEKLCACEEERYGQLASDSHTILEEYNNVLYKKSQKVTLQTENGLIETVIKEVDKNGFLLTEDSRKRRFRSGAIVFVS